MTLDDRLSEVFSDAFELKPGEIIEDMSVDTCSGWDSLRSISLSFSIEQTFDVEFTDAELLMMKSYSSIKQLLIAKGAS